MKKCFLLVLGAILIFGSCEKDIPETPSVSITSIYPKSAKQGDTLTVKIEYINCEPSIEIQAFVDQEQSEIVDYNDGRTIKVRIPDVIKFGILIIRLPNVESYGYRFDKLPNFLIKSIYPCEGGAGSKVTLKGFDFLSGLRTKFAINNNLCTIESITDTMAIITIPDGCGSGLIGGVSSSELDLCSGYSYFGPLFKYSFEEKKQLLKYYNEGVNTIFFDRDEYGRAIKRSYSKDNSYERFSYGSDELIDTIYYYINEELWKYGVFTRDISGGKTTQKIYYTNSIYINGLGSILEYYFNNEILVTKKEFFPKAIPKDGFYVLGIWDYNYNGNEISITHRTYFENGLESGNPFTKKYKVDLFNQVIKYGIPGDPEKEYFNVLSDLYSYSELLYNNFGNLTKITYKSQSCLDTNMYIHQYFYE